MKKMLLFLSLITTSLVYAMEERVNRIQQNPLLLFPEKREEREAARDRARTFAMALHPRLGATSSAKQLPQELVKEITTIARNAVVDEWLKQNRDAIKVWKSKPQKEKDCALKDAAKSGKINLVRILLYAGANTNAHGYLILNSAIYVGNTEIVRILLAAGADVNACCRWGNTPLHVAAGAGEDLVELVRLLLAVPGINVKAINDPGYTPLCLAANNGHVETARALLVAGGDFFKGHRLTLVTTQHSYNNRKNSPFKSV